MKEIWKDILNYEGLYQVSNLGDIKSLKRKHTKGCILRYSIGNSGYKQVVLCKNGECKTRMIHRLVAETFIENPNNFKEVNHKDENKLNNSVDNLEWCDRIYNQNYGTAIKRMVENHNYKECAKKGALKHNYSLIGYKIRKRILQKSIEGKIIKEWKGIYYAAKSLNLCPSGISLCCNNKIKTCGNYCWEYIKEDL